MARKNFEYGDTLTSADLEEAFVLLEGADAKRFAFEGNYSAVTTYKTNAVVWASSAFWVSLVDENYNITPGTDGTKWRSLSGATPLSTENVQDIVAAMIAAGANVTSTYDDAAGTLTIASTGDGTGLTTEQVQDIVGALLTAGTNVTLNYNDAAGTLTVTSAGGTSDAPAQNQILSITTRNDLSGVAPYEGDPIVLIGPDGTATFDPGDEPEDIEAAVAAAYPEDTVVTATGESAGDSEGIPISYTLALSLGATSPVLTRNGSFGGKPLWESTKYKLSYITDSWVITDKSYYGGAAAAAFTLASDDDLPPTTGYSATGNNEEGGFTSLTAGETGPGVPAHVALTLEIGGTQAGTNPQLLTTTTQGVEIRVLQRGAAEGVAATLEALNGTQQEVQELAIVSRAQFEVLGGEYRNEIQYILQNDPPEAPIVLTAQTGGVEVTLDPTDTEEEIRDKIAANLGEPVAEDFDVSVSVGGDGISFPAFLVNIEFSGPSLAGRAFPLLQTSTPGVEITRTQVGGEPARTSFFGTPGAAIPDSDGTEADNARAINALLAVARTKGIIAT